MAAARILSVGEAAYGLPASDDEAAWAALMRPCTGRLQLVQPGGIAHCFGRPTTIPVTVWVHCGVHFQRRRPADHLDSTPPVTGELPDLDRPGRRIQFFPLRRDVEAGQAAGPLASCLVRVFCAEEDGDLSVVADRWVVALEPVAPAGGAPLLFCAGTKDRAAAWERQLRMRTAPLSVVWSLRVSVPGSSAAALSSAGASTGGGPSASLVALAQAAKRALASDVLTGSSGVATAVSTVVDLAGAASPAVGVALETFCFALRVVAAARDAADAATQAAADLDGLHTLLAQHLLSALCELEGAVGVDAGDLLCRLGSLVAGLEVLAGELHHLLCSRRQRVRLACSTAGRGVGVGDDAMARLAVLRSDANELIQLTQLGLQRAVHAVTKETRQAVVDAPAVAAQHAAVKKLPDLPPCLYVDWNNEDFTAVQLYRSVMRDGGGTFAAVGTHGMGGVGKTLSCKLVAHKVSDEAAGRRRFGDGVFWVQLYKDVDISVVQQRMCAVATTLSGQPAEAIDLDMAVERLAAALEHKTVLIVVDDVWNERWVSVFSKAMRGATSSTLLFSTRQRRVASRRLVTRCVEVGVQSGTVAAGVLLAHAERGGVTHPDKTDARVLRAVELCGSLALALSVMGALVWDYGWEEALDKVDQQRTALLNEELPDADTYTSLWACLLASYAALGHEEGNSELWRERFRALCVLRTKEQLPWSALAALWNEDSLADTQEIARTLRNYSLVSLDGEDDPDAALRLSLHDLVVEFLARPALLSRTDRARFHCQLVSGYCRRQDITPLPTPVEFCGKQITIRPLWLLPADGFVEGALCHLLRVGEAADELHVLLFDMRFIAWRTVLGGGTCGIFRSDYRGLGLDVLDVVAAIVETAVAYPVLSMTARLQQAAFEVSERLRCSWSEAAGIDAARLAYLRASARTYMTDLVVELYGSTSLGLPRERRVLACHAPINNVRSVVSASGIDLVVIAGWMSETMEVWDVERGAQVSMLDGHSGPVRCLEVLEEAVPGGTSAKVVSGSDDGTVRVWDLEGAACTAVLSGHSGMVRCLVAVGRSGASAVARVVSGSDDGDLRLWNVEAETCTAVLSGHHCPVLCLAVLDGGGVRAATRLASGSNDGVVKVWDLDGGSCVVTLGGHTAAVQCLMPVTVGGGVDVSTSVVSGSDDGTVRMWDVESGACTAVFTGHTAAVLCLAFLPSSTDAGGQIVSGSRDTDLRLWDVSTRACVSVLAGHFMPVMEVEVLPGRGDAGPFLFSASRDTTVRVWDVRRRVCNSVLDGHTGPVLSLSILRDRSPSTDVRIVTSSFDESVRVWDIDPTVSEPMVEGHNGWVQCFAVLNGAADGSGVRVVSGSDDADLRVWDADRGACVAVLGGHTGPVDCLEVLHGGSRDREAAVLSGSRDGSLRVWDADRGACTAELTGHTDWVVCLALLGEAGSSSHGRAASGSRDNTARVWDLDAGVCLFVLQGHTNWVRSLVVPSTGGGGGGGARLVTASRDETLRVWDLNKGACQTVLRGSAGSIACAASVDTFPSGHGARVVAGTFSGALTVWDVTAGTRMADLAGHTTEVECMAAIDNAACGSGTVLVAGSRDGVVSLWDPQRGAAVTTLDGPARWTAISTVWSRPPGSTAVSAAAAAAAGDAPCSGDARVAEGVVLVAVVGCVGAVVDFRDDPLRLQVVPCPPAPTAVASISGGRLVWGNKLGRVYFCRIGW